MEVAPVQQATVRVVDPVTSSQWAEVVANLSSTLFHSPLWMGVLQNTYQFPVSACVVEEDGQPVGGVPWSDIEDVIGPRRVTLPFSDFCDILAQRPEHARVLAQYMVETGQPWMLRCLAKNLPALEVPVASSALFKWQTIDLTPDISQIWSRLSPTTRWGVRKAERSGIEIRTGDSKQQLRQWYLLHLRLRKAKYGLLAQPYAFFESIWHTFIEKGQGCLLLAAYQGRLIGGVVFIFWKDACYYKFSASDTEYLHLKPNNLLLWRGIQEAKERGFRLLDLGRSPVGQSGLIAYKKAFGASAEDLYAVTFSCAKDQPQRADRFKGVLSELTRLFVQPSVPDSVTEQAGALLYRFFA